MNIYGENISLLIFSFSNLDPFIAFNSEHINSAFLLRLLVINRIHLDFFRIRTISFIFFFDFLVFFELYIMQINNAAVLLNVIVCFDLFVFFLFGIYFEYDLAFMDYFIPLSNFIVIILLLFLISN